MKFIKIEELKTRKFQSLLDDISEDDYSIIADLELMAIEEITGYLNNRYDTDYIFSRTGSKRNALIRRLVMDNIVCNLYLRTNSNEIPEALMGRCEKNQELLDKIADGSYSPDLPTLDESQGSVSFKGGSLSRFNNVDHIS